MEVPLPSPVRRLCHLFLASFFLNAQDNTGPESDGILQNNGLLL